MQTGVLSTNLAAAARLIDTARRLGTREFCAGGGSRNSPLLAVLGNSPALRTWSFVDERSAGFFSLGRSKLFHAPVAVITTSGTAVAELLPAAVEAFYSGVPLLLITADRPRRFRGTGAPQAIEQPGIFGPYVEQSIDLEAGAPEMPEIDWSRRRPLHINVAFDEPLIDGPLPGPLDPLLEMPAPDTDSRVAGHLTAACATVASWRRPLLVISALASGEREAVAAFALRFGAPVYAESASGLREDERLGALLLRSGERILQRGGFDGVLRVGSVPTARFWRDLEESLRELPVVSVSTLPFPGTSRGVLLQGPVDAILPHLAGTSPSALSSLFEEDRQRFDHLQKLLDQEPSSELALVRDLSRGVPDDSFVFLGNSLPVREWDLAADHQPRGIRVAANRGANGIDGELSTFFGMCRQTAENWAVVGDLTAIYDLNAPWVVPQLDAATRFRLVIINNGGGRIFSRVPSLRPLPAQARERLVECSHDFGFAGWAGMWRIPYERWERVPAKPTLPDRAVIELAPDAVASRRLWEQYDRMWSAR